MKVFSKLPQPSSFADPERLYEPTSPAAETSDGERLLLNPNLSRTQPESKLLTVKAASFPEVEMVTVAQGAEAVQGTLELLLPVKSQAVSALAIVIKTSTAVIIAESRQRQQ
jgi:hypothetical protein